LEDLQAGAVAGLEKVIQYLLLLRGGVVRQQPGVTAAPADRADAAERQPRTGAVDADRRRRMRLRRDGGSARHHQTGEDKNTPEIPQVSCNHGRALLSLCER